MVASLHPTKVNLFYSSEFGSHVKVIPMTEWSPPSVGHDAGTVINWLSTGADVIDMMEGLVAALKPLFKDDTLFNAWTLYTTPDEFSPWTFQHAQGISENGTNASTTLRKAVQTTYTLQGTDGRFGREVLLDAPVISFDRLVGYDALTSDEKDLVDILMADDRGFCTRSGAQISVFRSRTATLNEKLRRAYKLT